MEGTPPLALVAGASVLIDIADANEAVLALVAQHVSRVIVPTPVLAEVDTLDELKCAALGLEVVEPTLDQLREAAVPHPALSFRQMTGKGEDEVIGEFQGGAGGGHLQRRAERTRPGVRRQVVHEREDSTNPIHVA